MSTIWLNGRLGPGPVTVSSEEPALRWGDGLFETMRAEQGRVRFLSRHLTRLARSAQALDLDIVDSAGVAAAVEATVARAANEHQRVRVTAGQGGLLLVESVEAAAPPQEPDLASAAVVADAWFPSRRFAEHKSLSYGAYRAAQAAAQRRGARIALLADGDGRLGEADLGNLVAVSQGELVTPPVDGLLPGIGREVLLEAGLLREGDLDAELLGSAEALFSLNAVSGLTRLRDVDGAPWSGEGIPEAARRAHAHWRTSA